MLSKLTLASLIVATISSPARADINGTLQEAFACPSGTCTTSCVGPGGPVKFTGYKQLTAWMISQPDRLWLQMIDANNNTSLTVLGVGDRCTFEGTPLKITVPIETSPLGPPPTPACNCIGNICNPPGCNSQ